MDGLKSASRPEQDAHRTAISSYAASGGRFAVLTDDGIFADLVESALFRILGSSIAMSRFASLADLLAALHRDMHAGYIVLLDRNVAGTRVDQVLGSILRAGSGIRIIMVTQDVDQYSAVLLVEHGAHNIITKPASIASVTEKLAFTIGPQGRFGRLVDRGKRLLEAGCWEEALQVGDEVLGCKPCSAAAYMLRGDAFMGLGMLERAEVMFLRAAESEKLYLAPLKRLAELYGQTGRTDKQLEYLRRLHAISPLNTERMLRIGELEIERGGSAAAGAMFEDALDLARREAADHEAALSGKIADICADSNPDMAVRYSRKSLALRRGVLSAKDIATVNTLGIVLRKQGKWREAMEEYQRILDVAPDNAGLIYNMALACSEGGDMAQAHIWVLKALDLEPDLPASSKNVAFNIGIIFQKAGFDGAPFFQKAHELDPEDERILEALRRVQRTRQPVEGEAADS